MNIKDFSSFSENAKIIQDWLNMKLKDRFCKEIDLTHEILIVQSNYNPIRLTPETSKIDKEIKNYLEYLINHLYNHPQFLEDLINDNKKQ